MPRRLGLPQKNGEIAEVGVVEGVEAPERHRQPVRNDGVAFGEACQRRRKSAAPTHVVFRRDFEEIDGEPTQGRGLHQLVDELPAKAEADATNRHRIFFFISPEHVPAPQLASPALAGFGGAAFAPPLGVGGLVPVLAAVPAGLADGGLEATAAGAFAPGVDAGTGATRGASEGAAPPPWAPAVSGDVVAGVVSDFAAPCVLVAAGISVTSFACTG